jgi:hypothetical protein
VTCRLRGPGCLSAYFLSPTVHLEPVKAFARLSAAGATTMDIWMETKDGKKVLDGTASVGAEDPAAPSALQRRLARERPPAVAGLRILSAGSDEGPLSFCLPHSRLYGESL